MLAQPNQPLLSMGCCFRGDRALCFGGTLGESIKARTTFFWLSLIFYMGLSSKIVRMKEPLQSAKKACRLESTFFLV